MNKDLKRLLDLLDSTNARAYLHVACGCEWGSRGERLQGAKCDIDALLERLRQQ